MGWWSNGKTPPRHGGNSGFEIPFLFIKKKRLSESQEEFTNYK